MTDTLSDKDLIASYNSIYGLNEIPDRKMIVYREEDVKEKLQEIVDEAEVYLEGCKDSMAGKYRIQGIKVVLHLLDEKMGDKLIK